MGLIVVQWGGTFYSADTGGSPFEIWSNSMALISDPGTNAQDVLESIYTLIQTWHLGDSAIDKTCALEFVKVNDFDITTGHQINDPTLEVTGFTRGTGVITNKHPVTEAARVSLDNGMRDRRTRGGFFIPRTTWGIQADGRYDPIPVGNAADAAKTLVDGINALTGVTVGVWSRKDKSITAVSRIRVGDVPDNISRRKDALIEFYEVRHPA